MLKITMTAASLLLLIASAVSQTADRAIVHADFLVLRACPAASCTEMARYPLGTEVRVLTGLPDSSWVQVSIPLRDPKTRLPYPLEIMGYMNGLYLDYLR